MRETEDDTTFCWGKFSDYIAQITGKCICETLPPPLVWSDY